MSLYIEYYEVGNEYWFMTVDADAKNKENFDNRSTRVWRFNTRTNRIKTIMDRSKDQAPVDLAEFFKIQLLAKPVPYDEYYLALEEVKRYREQHQTEESTAED
jgi:hypothetical protein